VIHGLSADVCRHGRQRARKSKDDKSLRLAGDINNHKKGEKKGTLSEGIMGYAPSGGDSKEKKESQHFHWKGGPFHKTDASHFR